MLTSAIVGNFDIFLKMKINFKFLNTVGTLENNQNAIRNLKHSAFEFVFFIDKKMYVLSIFFFLVACLHVVKVILELQRLKL